MSDLGIIDPHGERRGRFYTGSRALRENAMSLKFEGKAGDAYDLVQPAAADSPRPDLR